MFRQPKVEYKTTRQMLVMREAGLVLSRALDETVAAATVGVTTAELNEVFEGVLREEGATSNFLGYHGFPASICTSVNHEVVHGIPGRYALQDGDIISIDGGAVVRGWHSDSARTVIVGSPRPEDVRLSDVTEEAMWRGIAALASARFVGDIGTANYRSTHRGPKVRPGLCLAIEPMLVQGGLETAVLADDWTVITTDGKRASQWEHSVAVHDGGIWVLSAPDGGASRLEPLGVTPAPLEG